MRSLKIILVILFFMLSSGVLIAFAVPDDTPTNEPTQETPTENPTEESTEEDEEKIVLSDYELIF